MLLATTTLGAGGAGAIWAAVAVSPWFWALAVPLLAGWIFALAFFRDPRRSVPEAPGLMVAPADGKVTEVSRLDRLEGLDGPALKISIFLSVFDVHINRAPCGGHVVRTEYRPGEFLDARHPESGSRNENNTIVIEPHDDLGGPVIVRQVAGLIARRIVCNVTPGDTLSRGQRIGMIKFGSRTDLVVPADCGLEPAVRINDHVKGGETILLRPAKRPAADVGGRAPDERSAPDRALV